MRFLIAAFIVGVGVFVVWKALQPVCPQGIVAESEAQCAASGVFDRAFCRTAFAQTERIARSTGPSYATLSQCTLSGAICLPHLTQADRYVRKPVSWCITRRGGEPVLDPQYRNRG